MVETRHEQPSAFPGGGKGRWINMYSRNARAVHSSQSTADLAKSCMARNPGEAGVEQRWKKFLALLSHTMVCEHGTHGRGGRDSPTVRIR